MHPTGIVTDERYQQLNEAALALIEQAVVADRAGLPTAPMTSDDAASVAYRAFHYRTDDLPGVRSLHVIGAVLRIPELTADDLDWLVHRSTTTEPANLARLAAHPNVTARLLLHAMDGRYLIGCRGTSWAAKVLPDVAAASPLAAAAVVVAAAAPADVPWHLAGLAAMVETLHQAGRAAVVLADDLLPARAGTLAELTAAVEAAVSATR